MIPEKKKIRIVRDFFPCSCCGEHFSDRAKVWRHMNYNHGTGHFRCPKCPGETCMFPGHMTDHIKNFHANDPDYRIQCPRAYCKEMIQHSDSPSDYLRQHVVKCTADHEG